MTPDHQKMIALWLDAVPAPGTDDSPHTAGFEAMDLPIDRETGRADMTALVLAGLSVIATLIDYCAPRMGVEPEELIFDIRQIYADDGSGPIL